MQGAEIEARDVIPGTAKNGSSDEEWSVIDLKDEHCLIEKDGSANSKNRLKTGSSAIKHIKGAATVLGFGGSSQKQGKNRAGKSIFDQPVGPNDDQIGQLARNPSEPRTVLMSEGSVLEPGKEKKKGLMGFFNKEERDKKANKRDSEGETKPLALNGRSDYDYDDTCLKTSNLVSRPIGEGPDTKQIKKKLHSDGSASDFFIDKVTKFTAT